MADLHPSEAKKALAQKYNVCIRTAERYLYVANAFLEEKNELSLKRKTAYYIARKQRLIRSMDPAEKKTAAGVRVINGVLDSMAKMDGVLINKIDITTDGEKLTQTIIKTADGTVVTI
jgi:predicted GTPase